MPTRDIIAVMNDQAARIMALDGVVMVAVGQLDDGTPCIQVHATALPDSLVRAVGESLEGHPVAFYFSDEIRPLD